MNVRLLGPIREALEQGDLELAEQALIDSLYSSDAVDFWNSVIRLPSAHSIHHSLSFVSGLQFSYEESTAHVNLSTRVLTIGVQFFLDTLKSFADLLFVLFHERGHILVSLVYGSQMASFRTPKFGNLWEDVWINNTILFLMNSDLCSRVYADSPQFFRPLLSQEFTRWVAENHAWLQFHLKPRSMLCVRNVALTQSFFSQAIPYSEWMDLGLQVERALLNDAERKKVLATLGSGDLLGDMKGESDAPATPAQSHLPLADVSSLEGEGAVRHDVDGNPVYGHRVSPPQELPDALKQVLKSFAPNECPPEFLGIFKEMNLRAEIENTIVSDLVGDVLSTKQGEEVYQGKSASFQGLHRRDMFLVAAGYDLTLWTIDLPVVKPALKLYVDVSGSMHSYMHVVLLIHRYLHEFVDEHFQFSDSVVAVDPLENFIFSTGGTDYMAVAEHMIMSGCTEAVVLTDNTDSLSSAMIERLKKQLTRLYLVQTEPPGKLRGFDAIATKVINIPRID